MVGGVSVTDCTTKPKFAERVLLLCHGCIWHSKMCAARVFTEVFYRSRGNLVAVGSDMSERLTRDEGFKFVRRVKIWPV